MAEAAAATGEVVPAVADSVPAPLPPAPSAAPLLSREEVKAVAKKLADQPIQNPEAGVWAVLTAISKNARLRPQGMNILMSADEHCIGRCVDDARFQIPALSVSGSHCKIYRDTVLGQLNHDSMVPVFLKDASTNGTYHNWTRLRKNSRPARLQHGDIIALGAQPNDENSYSFVYREVQGLREHENGALKRKTEDAGNGAEGKRPKGIGIGSLDGPVSLEDVRSLQKSNTELRQELESSVRIIEALQSASRASSVQHENELKELKESITNSYLDQITRLQQTVDDRKKELDSVNASNMELRNTINDLNERLSSSKQSCADADEIIRSQKAVISDLGLQLEEERNLRREEREKAAEDMKSMVQRIQAEADDQVKRQLEVHQKQQRELQEVISKLQDSEKETRTLVETLRIKLEDTRENLITSENKVRQLEVQLQDEQLGHLNSRKKSECLQHELQKLRDEHEKEKAAREEAWAKVSALELEVTTMARSLSIEKQRFQGARERIILRETQLRAFYSTTEEISALFTKQQEQLKAMQKTLEDEEHYEDADAFTTGWDLNQMPVERAIPLDRHIGEQVSWRNAPSEPRGSKQVGEATQCSSSDGVSRTDRSGGCALSDDDGNTQEVESDVNNVDPAAAALGRAPMDTEKVLETESQAVDAAGGDDEQMAVLQRCGNLGGETMQLDTEAQPQENDDPFAVLQAERVVSARVIPLDTERSLRTTDLLASEPVGSWAVSTAPSVNGENESPTSLGGDNVGDVDGNAAVAADVMISLSSTAAGSQNSHRKLADVLLNSDGEADGSQSNSAIRPVPKFTKEHLVLREMIEIIDPERTTDISGRGDSMSDAETEDNDDNGSGSEAGREEKGGNEEDSSDNMIEDSVG